MRVDIVGVDIVGVDIVGVDSVRVAIVGPGYSQSDVDIIFRTAGVDIGRSFH